MRATTTTLSTPDGPFTIIELDGAVVSAGWTASLPEVLAQVHPTLRVRAATDLRPVKDLGHLTDAVLRYYDGDFTAAGTVPVHQVSGPFRSHAWEVLRTVRPGHPVTYAQYAELSGNPGAVRAAAGACARNAAALFVPCHRVIRTDGTMGGFRWGLAVKASLLERERSAADVSL